MQTKREIEEWYKDPDPWGYKTTQDDISRKRKILDFLSPNRYERILDIGCGEGFITTDLPGDRIYGIEWSDNAADRLPPSVTRIPEPSGKYDLVCTMGTLYAQYDHHQIKSWIKASGNRHILIAGILDWIIWDNFGDMIKEIQFPYREYKQIVRLYEIST